MMAVKKSGRYVGALSVIGDRRGKMIVGDALKREKSAEKLEERMA